MNSKSYLKDLVMTIDEVEMNIQSYKNFLIVKRLSFFRDNRLLITSLWLIVSIMKEHENRRYTCRSLTAKKTMYKLITDVAQELTKNVSLDIVYGFIRSTYPQ